jgi:hypothetical protein
MIAKIKRHAFSFDVEIYSDAGVKIASFYNINEIWLNNEKISMGWGEERTFFVRGYEMKGLLRKKLILVS